MGYSRVIENPVPVGGLDGAENRKYFGKAWAVLLAGLS